MQIVLIDFCIRPRGETFHFSSSLSRKLIFSRDKVWGGGKEYNARWRMKRVRGGGGRGKRRIRKRNNPLKGERVLHSPFPVDSSSWASCWPASVFTLSLARCFSLKLPLSIRADELTVRAVKEQATLMYQLERASEWKWEAGLPLLDQSRVHLQAASVFSI